MARQNFLLGKGERLTEAIKVKSGGQPKKHPYTFEEAKKRISGMLNDTIHELDVLPDDVYPHDQAIVSVTLNPEYIAKSYYPQQLFNDVGLQIVGSKPEFVTPEKKSGDRIPEEALTTELFARASRSALRNWNNSIASWSGDNPAENSIQNIEKLGFIGIERKLKGNYPDDGIVQLEVVLHLDEIEAYTTMFPAFESFMKSRGIVYKLGKSFFVKGLTFVELETESRFVDEIALFSLVRVLRQMPTLRMLRPTFRVSGGGDIFPVISGDLALDPTVKAAVFDGGIPLDHPIGNWVTLLEYPDMEPASEEFLSHGVAVSSAVLFGHLNPSEELPRPYCNVDHYRVVDDSPGQNPHELYEVLERIDSALSYEKYDFLNFSLGPDLPIEDDDVHAWTAVLDDRLAKSEALATVAVGNNGDGMAEYGLNRVQVPADCVNALAIGACDSPEERWSRASYSAIGPGRSPGIVKPDLSEFGGEVDRPFLVLSQDVEPHIMATRGTSFAAPSALRLATGIRAHFGENISNLAIRALLIHTAEESEHASSEVGWGRVARSLDDVVLCDDNMVRVVYQGHISPSKYIRAPIPFPEQELEGKVEIKATLCFMSQTDPHHPGNYTQAGLEVTFRPDIEKFKADKQVHPNSDVFFGKKSVAAGMTELELRQDASKWENCLHAKKNKYGKSLRKPCFDIHYNSRLEGRDYRPNDSLAYALVVTVTTKDENIKLYDQVVREYATQLEALRPVLEIPIRS